MSKRRGFGIVALRPTTSNSPEEIPMGKVRRLLIIGEVLQDLSRSQSQGESFLQVSCTCPPEQTGRRNRRSAKMGSEDLYGHQLRTLTKALGISIPGT